MTSLRMTPGTAAEARIGMHGGHALRAAYLGSRTDISIWA